jgi:hypothetical protein
MLLFSRNILGQEFLRQVYLALHSGTENSGFVLRTFSQVI